MSGAHFPVRCVTCGKPIAQLWETYSTKVDDISEDLDSGEKFTQIAKILDDLHISRICCRRMFMTHVDISHIQMMYPTYPDNVQRIGVKTKSAKPKNYTIKSTTGDEDDPQSLDENVDSEENEDDDVELEDGDDDIEDDE